MAETPIVTRPGIVGQMLEVLYPDGVPKGEVRRLPRVVMHLDVAATVQRGQVPALPLHAHFEADPEPLISVQEKCGPGDDDAPIPFELTQPEPSGIRLEGATQRQRGGRPRVDWDNEPRLGQVNPADLAREYGVTVSSIHKAMKARGLVSTLRRGQRWTNPKREDHKETCAPSPEPTSEPEPTPEPETPPDVAPVELTTRPPRRTGGPKGIDWASETRLGTMSDGELGRLLGCSGQQVQTMRIRRGIAAFCKTGRPRNEAGTPLTHRYRALVIPNKHLTPDELEEGKSLTLDDFEAPTRPTKRSECVDGPRPCPWVSCRYHLAVEVTSTGALKMPHGHVDLEAMPDTCALDVADRGVAEGSLEELGAALGVTRERARQEVENALERVRDMGITFEGPVERRDA